jgi:hypothetical protein
MGTSSSASIFVCADEDTAKEQAKSLVDGYRIELWQSVRKVATFEPDLER